MGLVDGAKLLNQGVKFPAFYNQVRSSPWTGSMRELRPSPERPEGCFRSLLLVTCPYLSLTKALVPDLQPTNSGDAKYRRLYHYLNFTLAYQQLMADAPTSV